MTNEHVHPIFQPILNAIAPSVSSEPASKPKRLCLDSSQDLPRDLQVSLTASGRYIDALTMLRTGDGVSTKFIADTLGSAKVEDCSILTGGGGRKTLLVGTTHFTVTDDEARQLVECFGFREWQ